MNTPSNQTDTTQYDGVVFISAKGAGFVKVKDLENSIEIAPDMLATALHGDKVTAIITGTNEYGSPTGKITSIVTRSKRGFAGTLVEESGKCLLRPSDPKMHLPIEIKDGCTNGANLGQKVFAVITDWKSQADLPKGEVTHVLGMPMENNAEMQGLALEKGFDSSFPSAVDKEAEAWKTEGIPASEIAVRRDMRGTTTFTIDPADAKDFDDALSFKKLDNGNFEIGIHIADVSHYVRPGTELDKEAYQRATSVYLVDRTIPMLPEALSNELCSLNPNEDKFTMSAVFELNDKGDIISEWFGKSIIHSDKRFTYEEAQGIINAKTGIFYEELDTLNKIAKNLTVARMKAGALSLDQDEVRFVLDENAVPIKVYKKERGDTNKLIEEFMLLANRKVAEFIAKKSELDENIFVYRIHDLPNKEKMHELSLFLKKLGYPVTLKDGIIPSVELNRVLEKLEGKEEKNTVHTSIIRSMAKAIYSTENIGHYGLAFEYYTHFTSPIRRYPDTIVHRLLEEYLQGHTVPKEEWENYMKICQHSSDREKEAADAERASIKYKQVEYMSYRIGQVFDGVVSGISKNGIFVEEKESKCEGMIRLRDLGSDFYSFNDKDNTIVGRSSRKVFKIGDNLRIKVTAADMQKRIIDYTLSV